MRSLLVFLFALGWMNLQAQEHTLNSPGKNIQVSIQLGTPVTYYVSLDGTIVSGPNKLGIEINSKKLKFHDSLLTGSHTEVHEETLTPAVPEKNAEIEDRYEQLTLSFEPGYDLQFRLYDNGVAYRYVLNSEDDSLFVNSELIHLDLPKSSVAWYPSQEGLFSSNEFSYSKINIDTLKSGLEGGIPVTFRTPNGIHVAILESDLIDYPGFFLRSGKADFEAVFPNYPKEELQESDRYVRVVEEEPDYIAKTKAPRSLPWRIQMVNKDAKGLLSNQLVYQLASETKIDSTNWIKPGKVAWDWFNGNILHNVDFESGLNTETYKYYIDFASRYGIEYVILDEGWSTPSDLMQLNPEIDVKELVRYGKEKDVEIILWVVWITLEKQLDEAFEMFEELDVAGIKVDFMNRNDQWMVNYYHKIARLGAEHKLLVNFHGSYKPSGLRRMYPNVITREGVKGLEHTRWSEDVTPTHNTTIPFTRMLAGPMDYTPGVMYNTTPGNFRDRFYRAMSMGTRAHEIAKFVVYESPLQMLADSPSNYLDEPAMPEFISQIPTTWDKTVPLEAEVGEYIVVARKHGKNWYIGGMANEEGVPLSFFTDFLEPGLTYSATIIRDGANAHRFAEDYIIEEKELDQRSSLYFKIAPSGGFAVILKPETQE